MELLSGFLVGLLGSFHCIGMCGPIALALPKSRSMVTSRVLYNTGRIVTYSILGLAFGLLGSRLNMIGLQQIVSITLGVLIIASVITPVTYRMKLSQKLGLYRAVSLLKSLFGKMLKEHSLSSMVIIGILNGFLPCGFVYIAVTGAIAIGSPAESMLFMAMFGLGTVPVMLGTSLVGGAINLSFRQKLSRLIPALSIALAVIFILRGLNLGIPYLSPKLVDKSSQTQDVICH